MLKGIPVALTPDLLLPPHDKENQRRSSYAS